MAKSWTVKPTIKYIPVIIATGIALGVASLAIGLRDNLTQALVLHTLTSLCIGYPLLLIAANKHLLPVGDRFSTGIIILGLVFALIGVVAAEIELIVGHTFFFQEPYQFFSGGGIHWFNAILTVILGFSIYNAASAILSIPETQAEEEHQPSLTSVPVKKGDAIHLLKIDTISVIEAADKYAYVYDVAGAKYLCDYSLGFLEGRLPEDFIRVHRSYIVHTRHIARVRVFDKKRYTLEFQSPGVPVVQSSASYQQSVRDLIKL